jgi:hypothetical protein
MSTSDWRIMNGWRELFARIFEEFDTQFNVVPEWLVNPATNRRLKLDMLYPNLGVAVRFEGAQGKQRRRLSLEEEEQQRVRFNARMEVCWQHGIQLIIVDPVYGKPAQVFQQVDTALSRVAAAQPNVSQETAQKIRHSRSKAADFSRKISSPEQLGLYADLWSDRQYQIPTSDEGDTLSEPPVVTFATGMEVEHTHFGPGRVISMKSVDDDTFITVDFVTDGVKTLAVSLVAGKLHPK